jgi:hypothetical protein
MAAKTIDPRYRHACDAEAPARERRREIRAHTGAYARRGDNVGRIDNRNRRGG